MQQLTPYYVIMGSYKSHLNDAYSPSFYVILKVYSMGATWLRRGLQNRRCMPRMRTLVNQTQLNTNANDENFAGEAIAA